MNKFIKFFKNYGLYVLGGLCVIASIAVVPLACEVIASTVGAVFASIGIVAGGCTVAGWLGVLQHSINTIKVMKREGTYGKNVKISYDELSNEDKEQLEVLRRMRKEAETRKNKKQKKVADVVEDENSLEL